MLFRGNRFCILLFHTVTNVFIATSSCHVTECRNGVFTTDWQHNQMPVMIPCVHCVSGVVSRWLAVTFLPFTIDIELCYIKYKICVYIYGGIAFTWIYFPRLFFCQEQCDHSFKEAMKLEAVNPLSPENIHVATVTRVKGQYVWLSLEGNMGVLKECVYLRWKWTCIMSALSYCMWIWSEFPGSLVELTVDLLFISLYPRSPLWRLYSLLGRQKLLADTTH